jgi:hypothetical protein
MKRPLTDAERVVSIREAITAAHGVWSAIVGLWSIQSDLHWLLARAEAPSPRTDPAQPVAAHCEGCGGTTWDGARPCFGVTRPTAQAAPGLDVERLAWAVHRGCTIHILHPYEDGPDEHDRELAEAYAERYASPTQEARAALNAQEADR